MSSAKLLLGLLPLAALVVGCGDAAPQPAAAPRASSLLVTLQASGLDPAKLPASPRLLPEELRDRVMDSFVLDRRDDDALAAWMQDNFVGKLARRDGAQHGCATCHGDPFDGEFLDEWKKGSVGG